MFSRWYTAAVLLFWLAAMGWLVKEKILPPLLVGDPPSYRTILAVEPSETEAVGWEILLNGKRLGGATTKTIHLADSINQFECQVTLRDLPLSELTPAWLTAFVKVLDSRRNRTEANIDLYSKTTIEVNSLNQPFAFSSMTKFGPPALDAGDGTTPQNMELSVAMSGKIEGNTMNVTLRSGELEYHTKIDIPADALMGDILSPQTYLPGLRIGQTWTVPIYSPFRAPTEPLEILHATVERKDPIFWHERIVPALLAVYRGDPGLGLSSNQSVRAQMWVDYDGRVVKQEVWMLSSRLTFVRSDPEHDPLSHYMPDFRRPKPSSSEDFEEAEEIESSAEPVNIP